MFRLHHLALASLALLCLFVIVAGIAVARILPPRLARWDVPRVGARSLAAAGPAPRAVSGVPRNTAGGVTPAGLARVLGPLASSSLLGSHVGVLVSSLHTGQVLYDRGGAGAFAPASTAKVATAVAALDVLGPGARFRTRVVAGRSPGSIVLVGGGDPTLAAARPPAADYPRDATLVTLAARAAQALRRRGQHRVTLDYDTSLYSGPGLAPGWPLSYVTTGNVTPISSLEVDQGRLTRGGAPEDADDPGNLRPRTMTPAPAAAAAFAGFLAADGIQVTGSPRAARAPAGAGSLAVVTSPPLAQLAQQMLQESNNIIAENLARHLAIARGRPASFSGAAAAEQSVLRGLGVTGISLVDGSGLSPRDRITPKALVAAVRLAASPARPGLRPAISGLPVAGFSGTLAPGGSVFAGAGPAALGVVRAKTGNLTTVASLAGIAYARNGQLLSFAFMADKLPAKGLAPAGAQIARLATALAGCGCGGSG